MTVIGNMLLASKQASKQARNSSVQIVVQAKIEISESEIEGAFRPHCCGRNAFFLFLAGIL